jgi:hypothetical protein
MARAKHCFKFHIDIGVDSAGECEPIRECDIDELCGIENHLTKLDDLMVIEEWSAVRPSEGMAEAMAEKWKSK